MGKYLGTIPLSWSTCEYLGSFGWIMAWSSVWQRGLIQIAQACDFQATHCEANESLLGLIFMF